MQIRMVKRTEMPERKDRSPLGGGQLAGDRDPETARHVGGLSLDSRSRREVKSSGQQSSQQSAAQGLARGCGPPKGEAAPPVRPRDSSPLPEQSVLTR